MCYILYYLFLPLSYNTYYLDISVLVEVWASWYVFQAGLVVFPPQSPEQLGSQVCTAVPSSSLFLILNLYQK